ncbi:TetR/AcrR family transcriptional regulator [Iamia sp. SCSIO 61187]|uniref:TetR/AcrR family transcriptional regulator n=1 Tax=Iamia sp. SCSIO 61187 TaxID=2722752 RepID=UPI001C63B1A0|nr:TetR/AcrR family transcriptional regulator [Iamia sp. SCSIO 61187]QYG93562.1 TetR/AcrR family transcriptional regulator [Iamia sp. SCSIO 61187]
MAMPAEPLEAAPPPPADGDAPADALGDRLLEAAAEVFAERGYDRAGVAQIARRAGVTTGAIYSRYAGKAELLVAALEAHTTDELDSLFADHRFEGRAQDVLAIAGSHLVERSASPETEKGTALLNEAFIAARRDPAVAALLHREALDRQTKLRALIEAAKETGGISTRLDTEALVTFCHALGFGFLLLDVADVPMPAAQPWEQLIAHLLAALADPPTPTS